MTLIICDQERAFHAALDEDSCDWSMRLVFADWLEEQGRCDEAACQRWMVENQKAPRCVVCWSWYTVYQPDISVNHILPNRFRLWFFGINNYYTRVRSEEALMLALKYLGEI